MNFLDNSNYVSKFQPDYKFAFNERNYSYRVMMIEIIPHSMELKPEGCCNVDDSARKSKRKREEIKTRRHGFILSILNQGFVNFFSSLRAIFV